MRLHHRVAAVIAAATLTLASIGTAMADVIGGSTSAPQFAGIAHQTVGHDIGSFVVDGKRVFCIDTSGRGGTPYVDVPSYLTAPTTVTPSTEWERIAAYVLSQYGNSTDAITAASVHYIVAVPTGYDSRAGEIQWSWDRARATYPALQPRYDALVAEARANSAAPSLSVSATVSADKLTGSVNVGANFTAPIVVTLTGSAVFTSTGTQTATTSGSGSLPIQTTGGGTFRVSARATDLPATTITLYPAPSAGVQRVMTAGARTSASASDPTAYDTTSKPRIETTSSADGDKLRAGDSVTDTIRVTKGRPGTTLRIQTRLYGPVATRPAQSPSAPTGTPLLSDGHVDIKLDASGNGTVTTAPVKVEKTGWYSYDTDWAGDIDNAAVDAGYGVPAETGYVSPWTPEATTRTSDQLVTGPGELTDTVVVSGGKPGAPFTGSATLYGPFATDPSAGGGIDLNGKPSVGSTKLAGTYDANGNAEVTTPPVSITEPGFYVWAETINGVPGVSERWQQTRAMASETSVNIKPTIVTTVNDQMVLPGHTISDRVELAGLVNTVGGKRVTHAVTGSLYGPVAPVDGSCKLVNWKGAPVAATLPSTPVTAAPDGTAKLDGYGPFVVTKLGCYTYAETLTSSVEGDPTPVVVEHEPGNDAQTTVALTPTVETRISAPMVKPGEPVTDTIHVNNTAGTPWTITASLWQMQAPSCIALTHADWTKAVETGTAKTINEQTLTGTGDDTVTTKPVSFEQTGCVTWQTTAEFEGSTTAVESQFGIPSESGTVLLPKVETVAKTSGSHAGADIYDTIRVTGMYGHEGILTGHVLGPVESATGRCEAVDWTGAPKPGDIEPIDITGDGEYTSSSIKTTAAGCYTFVETLTVGDIEVHMEAGIPSETVYLAPVPSGAVDHDSTGSGSDTDSTGTGHIEAGEPSTGGWNAGLVAAGLVMLAGACGVGYRGLRRS